MCLRIGTPNGPPNQAECWPLHLRWGQRTPSHEPKGHKEAPLYRSATHARPHTSWQGPPHTYRKYRAEYCPVLVLTTHAMTCVRPDNLLLKAFPVLL